MGDKGEQRPEVIKLLVAEDNQDQQELIKSLMNYWGYDFDIAANGQRAVELAGKNEGEYDLCLMDIDMPLMNGFEATKIIRRKIKYLPIMALTGNTITSGECRAGGMDDYLKKPYDPNELYDKITELTTKSFSCELKGKEFFLKKEMPMDQRHAQELKELAKEGLCKLNIRGIGAHDVVVVTHKNVPCKISRDFIENNEEVSIFLDRSKDKPSECHLYKSSCPMPTIYLRDEEYKEKKEKEDEILKHCTEMVIKKKA
jgi:CheY-like chemotaxis protein